MAAQGTWSEEQIDRLRELAAARLSAGQIAERISAMGMPRSRCSVIGMCRRKGIKINGSKPKPPRPKRKIRDGSAASRKAAETVRRMKAARAAVSHAASIPPASAEVRVELGPPSPPKYRKTTETLTASCCRWPIGDVQSPEFHYCGEPRLMGLSYCEQHARRAFQTSPSVEVKIARSRAA